VIAYAYLAALVVFGLVCTLVVLLPEDPGE